MRAWTLKGLRTAFVAVLLVWGGVRVAEVIRARPSAEEVEALERVLHAADPESVVAIHMPGGTRGPVRLARDGRRWTVNGHEADSLSVALFWLQLSALRVAEVVTRSPEGHARFGLDGAAALPLVFERQAAADTLLVGVAGPGRDSFYARIPGHNAVYRLQAPLRRAVLRVADDWRDRRILELDTAALGTVTVAREDGVYTLTHAPAGWTLDGDAVDEGVLQELLQELGSLRASGFELSPPGNGAPPDRALTVLDRRGDLLATLELREIRAARWIARRGDEPTVYVLPQARVDRLTPGRAAVERQGADERSAATEAPGAG